MEEYRRGAHSVYDIKYHLIWITKYRYKVLRGRVAERVRDLIRQSCEARGVAVNNMHRHAPQNSGYRMVCSK